MEVLKVTYEFKFKNSVFPSYLTNELHYSSAPIENDALMENEIVKAGETVTFDEEDYYNGLIMKGKIEGSITLEDGYIAHYEISKEDIETITKAQIIRKTEVIHKNY